MTNSNLIKISCSVEEVRYYKNEWGIAKVSVNTVKQGTPKTDAYNCLIIKGVMPPLVRGKTYFLTAEYVDDPKWGGQYNIISIYSTITLDDNSGESRKKFLLSLYTELQVKNMYDALSDPFSTLEQNDASQLVKVKGCGMDTAVRWIDKFNENISLSKIFTELDEYNLTNNMVQRLVDKYKSPDVVVEKVKNNPYVLCDEVNGIGWKMADRIALDGGISKYSTQRIGAYIVHYLDERGQNGCSWITPDELLGAILETLGDDVPDENITEAIHELDNKLWWNKSKTRIGLMKYYYAENRIAEELLRLYNADSRITYTDWESAIKHVEHKQGWQFTDEQTQGVKTALDNNIVIIHGEAGTGKTSMVSALLEILKEYSFVQCALSGRASSRMAEVTGQEGYTIHRLLGYHGNDPNAKNGFTYHEDNKLPYDIYILDEISMVDAFLFCHLLRAIPDGSKLICLGDMGQLESIGCGNVAYDMIHSSVIPTVYLSKIHRQAAESAIITEARRIRRGEQIIEKDWTGTERRGVLQDLTIDCYSDSSNTFYKIMQAFSACMARADFDIMETQILVPVKSRGDACTWKLNDTIQELYNPHASDKPEISVTVKGRTTVFRVGDKVINTRNNYKTQPAIYNGNIGIITDINLEEDYIIIAFNGIGEVLLERKHLSCIELGYAITVHKAQGSQFSHVIFGIDFVSYALLTRELLYTGITRATHTCDLIAQTGALRVAVDKEGVSNKQTHLQQCLYDKAHAKVTF